MILTLLAPAPAWARSLPLPSTASIPGCSSTICMLQTLTCQLSSFSGRTLARSSLIFSLLLGSSSSPVIGRLCAYPELQFRRPITGKEAELLSDPGDVAR
ncbi:unnamed protein product [Staurois parvus]|uniref:Secreted protein n=1 Tax=Staurois parvus TaxID=386267 RepID=A0ABN9EKJ0_9NEOB|nr:unnamed protein product [Staurois parvus]